MLSVDSHVAAAEVIGSSNERRIRLFISASPSCFNKVFQALLHKVTTWVTIGNLP
jgi:hypothetical protein